MLTLFRTVTPLASTRVRLTLVRSPSGSVTVTLTNTLALRSKASCWVNVRLFQVSGSCTEGGTLAAMVMLRCGDSLSGM